MKTMILVMLASVNLAVSQSPLVAKATFGRYSDSCIAGRGLCSFDISNNNTGNKTGVKFSANTVVLKLKRSDLSADDEIKIAGKRFKDFGIGEPMFFKQPDNLLVSASTLLSLRINQSYNNIAPGTYPVKLTDETVEIVLTLTSSRN